MKYINVINKLSIKNQLFDSIPLTIEQSGGSLISLNKELTKKDLLNKKFHNTPNKIKNFRGKYVVNNTSLWIDSGGYDVLSNKIMSAGDIDFYIDYYVDYLRKYNGDFDNIFSLDFSASPKKNNWFNTKNNIYEFNNKSINKTLEVLKENSSLADKLYFVYQFKTKDLFDIWEKLYKENDLGSIIKNRAIGGLVSIDKHSNSKSKSKTGKITFSPIIGPAFNCFQDFIYSNNKEQYFKLHFLGVSNLVDRFSILLLEKYFDKYFIENKLNIKTSFTYDTSGYSHIASKRYSKTEIYHFDKINIDRYKYNIRFDPDIRCVAENKLFEIYHNHVDSILSEINDKTSWEERVVNTEQFIPLIIYSNRNIDNYFDLFIKNNNLIDIVFNASNLSDINYEIDNIFEKLAPLRELKSLNVIQRNRILDDKYTLYKLFTEDFRQRVVNTCVWIFDFHTTLTKNRLYKQLFRNKLLDFINKINFEFELT